MKKSLMVSIALALMVGGRASTNAQPHAKHSDADIVASAQAAYIFGYPLVSMYVTKRVSTNVVTPSHGRAPLNQVGNLFKYPTAAFRDVVAPNVNTLYSSAWLDLSKEPIVVHMPDTQGRYYVMETLDFWTNVMASPGKRTTGTGAQDIAFIGPDWKGQMPSGITLNYRSPTNTIWVLNRIQTNGPKDYGVVNALQRQITTTPLSAFGKPHTWPPNEMDPSIDTKTAVRTQVNKMTGDEFFTAMARAMMENRPVAEDSTIVRRMATIGLRPGSEFKMDPAQAVDVRAGATKGLDEIVKASKTGGRVENGWMSLTICGQYGTKYLTRAVVALIGLGCNLLEDAFYPTTWWIRKGRPSTAPTATSFASRLVKSRRSRPFGQSPCTTKTFFSSRTRSIAERSARGTI